jgi:hypothetical protein
VRKPQRVAPLTTKSTSWPSQAEQRGPPCPIDDGGIAATARYLIGDSGLDLVSASLAPHDQPHLGAERLAKGHRAGLALAPFAPHNPTMPSDLTEDDKAIIVELLRETIERDRFPLSPRIKRLRAILAKLAPLAPRPEPLPARSRRADAVWCSRRSAGGRR